VERAVSTVAAKKAKRHETEIRKIADRVGEILDSGFADRCVGTLE
jgi:hypothetical protein